MEVAGDWLLVVGGAGCRVPGACGLWPWPVTGCWLVVGGAGCRVPGTCGLWPWPPVPSTWHPAPAPRATSNQLTSNSSWGCFALAMSRENPAPGTWHHSTTSNQSPATLV